MQVNGAGEGVVSSTPQLVSETVAAPLLQSQSQLAIGPLSSSSGPSTQQPAGAPQLQQQKPKSKLQLDKEEVIRRAKERKTFLEAELKKVKLQLWECTIEQGGLHHVLGHYQDKERKRKAVADDGGDEDMLSKA